MAMKTEKSDIHVTISNRTVLRVLGIIIAVGLALNFIQSIAHPLTLIFISFFLALALNPVVSWLSRRLKLKSRATATGAAYLMVLVVLIGFFTLVVPPLVKQTTSFIRTVPDTIRDFKDQDSSLARLARQYNVDDQIDKFGEDLGNRVGGLTQPVVSTAGRVLTAVVSLVIVLVMTFMMLVEGPMWAERFFALQPSAKREHRRRLAYKMYRTVTGYVNGQLLIAVIAGLFAFVALMILSTIFDVSINVIALAGIVTIFGLIPMIGNTLAAILVTLFCLFISVPLAIAVAVFFIIYQQVENATLQPYIQSRSNQLTPLIVFIAAIIGAGFGGLLGALVAIPLAGCLRLIVEDQLNKRLPSRQQVEDNT